MFTITRRAKIGITALLAAAAIATTAGVISSAGTSGTAPDTFEVSEDASRFVFDFGDFDGDDTGFNAVEGVNLTVSIAKTD